MSYYINLSSIFILFSCLIYSFFYKHILLTLISLEFLMLSVFYLMYMLLLHMCMDLLFMYMFMVLMICESVLGVSILILMVRLVGNDYYKMFNLMSM